MEPMTMMAIGAGMQAGASILQGFMGSKQKKNEAAVAKYNAAVKRQEVKSIEYQTKFLQGRQAEAGARVQGELKAAIGGSGIVSTQGAPMLALALQKSESDLENYMIGFEGMAAADRAENEALQYDMQKQFARIGAKQAMIGGFLGAAGSAGGAMMQIPGKTAPTSLTGGTGKLGSVSNPTSAISKYSLNGYGGAF